MKLSIFTSIAFHSQAIRTGWPDRDKWVGCWRGVRTDRWVYARWHNENDHEPVLFDRTNDPYEINNLAGNPRSGSRWKRG